MNILSCEDLKKLSEDTLKKLCLSVRSTINKNKRLKKDSKELEIYFCYIIRELENRSQIRAIN